MTKHIKSTLPILLVICLFKAQSALGQDGLLKTVHFEKNSYRLSKSEEHKLKAIAKICASDSTGIIKIYGFTDKSGSEQYNDELAEKRANTVYNALLSYEKIDTTYIYVQWFGESTEVYDTHLNGLSVQDRAVDIYIQFNGKKKKH